MLDYQIIYIGEKQYARVDTPFKNTYEFTEQNNYTISPLIWGDFYYILSIDGPSHKRNFILKGDDTGYPSLRRISQSDLQETKEYTDILERQKDIEAEAEREKEKERYIDEYKNIINGKIIKGELDVIPSDINEKALQYALNKMSKKEDNKEENVSMKSKKTK